MKRFTTAFVVFLALACITAVTPANADNSPIIGGSFKVSNSSEDVIVTALGKDASHKHFLSAVVEGRVIPLFSSSDKGSEVNLGTFEKDTVVHFALNNITTGYTYYTGDASNNPDNEPHVKCTPTDTGDGVIWEFGFEDIYGGGDRDYDDCMFTITSVEGDDNGDPIDDTEPFVVVLQKDGWYKVTTRTAAGIPGVATVYVNGEMFGTFEYNDMTGDDFFDLDIREEGDTVRITVLAENETDPEEANDAVWIELDDFDLRFDDLTLNIKAFPPPEPAPAPVADAGPDRIVYEDSITLDGSNSHDPGGDDLNYTWLATHRDTDEEMGAIGMKPTLNDLEYGAYDVVLTVENGEGLTDTDAMVFEVVKPTLIADPTHLSLVEGESGRITLVNGSAPYELLPADPRVATAVSMGDVVTVKGMSVGHTSLVVTDETGDSVTVAITVTDDGIDMLRIEEFGEGFTFDYDERYDAGNGTLVFQVKDQNGFPVNELTIENFEFIQDKVPADIESFADVTADRILNVSMVLDASYSMSLDDAHIKLKEAAGALVERLGDNADLRYYRFANRVEQIGSVNEIELDEKDRFTSMYDAVYRAIEDSNHELEERIIVLFSDGADNHSLRRLSELTSLIEKHNIVVYSIGLGDVKREDLDAVSENGAVVMAENAEALHDTFDLIGSYLKSIYTVTYWTPSRVGIHELEFRVHKGGLYSNTIATFFEALVDKFHALANAIRSPKFTVEKSGNTVTVSWEDVDNADGYIFYYAPPDISFVKSIDAGKQTTFTVDLWSGFTYYTAVQPYNTDGDIGGMSNIELVEIP